MHIIHHVNTVGACFYGRWKEHKLSIVINTVWTRPHQLEFMVFFHKGIPYKGTAPRNYDYVHTDQAGCHRLGPDFFIDSERTTGNFDGAVILVEDYCGVLTRVPREENPDINEYPAYIGLSEDKGVKFGLRSLVNLQLAERVIISI